MCICFIGKSVLVVSQKTLRGMDAVACGMSSTTIVQIALTCEREMPTAGRTVGASRSVSPGPPRSPWAHASVKRNCISCQPGAGARRVWIERQGVPRRLCCHGGRELQLSTNDRHGSLHRRALGHVGMRLLLRRDGHRGADIVLRQPPSNRHHIGGYQTIT